MNLFNVRFYGAKYHLKNHVLITLSGADAHKFFQGHGTNDFLKLNENSFHLDCRLDVAGKIQSFFYAGKINSSVYLICSQDCSQVTVNNLEKYIIMEDVEVSNKKVDFICIISPFIDEIISKLPDSNCFLKGLFLNEEALILWGQNIEFAEKVNLPELENEEYRQLRLLSAWPEWNEKINQRLVNETSLEEYAISFSKGCFLGQETVAKIHNNRGGAYYPMIGKALNLSESLIGKDFTVDGRKGGSVLDYIKIEDDNILLIEVFRDYRIDKSILTIEIDNENYNLEISTIPYFKNNLRSTKAIELYENAIASYQKDDFESSISLLEHCIELDSSFADAYETLGVIKGKMGQYEEAIDLMNLLLKVDPGSVLAHTNKSLFYMNLGRIEEAEQEKSLATTKSFEMADKNTSKDDIQLQERQKKEQELQKREAMFLQVLEIDDQDGLANFGMGEICFYRKNYSKSVEYIDKVLNVEPDNSNAYLLMGKALEGLGKAAEAKDVYDKGIRIASKKGQHKQASEMHSRLSSL